MVIHVERTWDGLPLPAEEAVRLELTDAGAALRLRIEAPFNGDPPPPGEPGPLDGLWEHEVVELFVAHRHSEAYLEVELSPHGHHLVLALTGVRQAHTRGLPLRYRARIAGSRWTGEALVPREWLPPAPHRINATAVRGVGVARRYLSAEPLPGDRPDFHRLGRFRDVDLPARSRTEQ